MHAPAAAAPRAGVLKVLSQHYDLASTPIIASSSGALVSAMAVSGVDMDAAAERAVELSREYSEGRG